MLFTFLSRIMASVLTTLLFVAVVGFTANQTILNTGYVEDKLQTQKAYDRLSVALSEEISNKSDDPSIPKTAIAEQLKGILTPAVLQQKIETTLKQLQAYYDGKGPVPTLDISDLINKAEDAGIEINEQKFNKPVELTALEKTKKVSDIAKLVSIGALVVMALLFAGILAIAIKRRDFRPLANIVFSLGLMLTITGAALLFVPSIFDKLYKFDPVKNPFGSLASDLATSTIRDFGLRLLIAGVIALVLGVLAKIVLRRRKQRKPLDYAKAEPATAPVASTPIAPPVSIEDAPTTPEQPKADVLPGAPPAPRQRPKPRKIQL